MRPSLLLLMMNSFISAYFVKNHVGWRYFSRKFAQIRTDGVDKMKALVDNAEAAVVLVEGKANLFKNGNPIVYSGAIESVLGSPVNGDLVKVVDRFGNLIGKGFFNSISQYRVRMIASTQDPDIESENIEELITNRIKQAINVRKQLGLPSTKTNAYRLVNGEGDSLSGLMVDVYKSTTCVQSSALWAEKYQDIIKASIKQLVKPKPDKIIWKQSESRLQKDGYIMTNKPPSPQPSADSAKDKKEAEEKSFWIKENGISYRMDEENNQKTGFYCDQRENRLMIRSLSVHKRRVLDCYCYTGGFAINAIKGGAQRVVAVDSSKSAIEALQANCAMNNVAVVKAVVGEVVNALTSSASSEEVAPTVQAVEGDCMDVMQKLLQSNNNNNHDNHEMKTFFDMIILDPPKLAPSRSTLEKATAKYTQINAHAMQLIDPQQGGLLFTCTCSAAMTQTDQAFIRMLQNAAKIARRKITVLSVSQAALDHGYPAAYTEGNYLTGMLLHVT